MEFVNQKQIQMGKKNKEQKQNQTKKKQNMKKKTQNHQNKEKNPKNLKEPENLAKKSTCIPHTTHQTRRLLKVKNSLK